MIQQVLSHFHLPLLTSIGLLLFMAVFIGVSFWVYRTGSAEEYGRAQGLPLIDERAGK